MNDLEVYRQQIDEVDRQLIDLLSQRLKLAKKIGEYKKSINMEALQPARWQEVLRSRKEYANMIGVDEKAIEDIWNVIHIYSLEQEK